MIYSQRQNVASVEASDRYREEINYYRVAPELLSSIIDSVELSDVFAGTGNRLEMSTMVFYTDRERFQLMFIFVRMDPGKPD